MDVKPKKYLSTQALSLLLSGVLSIGAILVTYHYGRITSYNDATAHLNIARRIFDSLNPGLAQLGSVWLPLLHILQLPFVTNHFLWQSGLAGSIVSGGSFLLASYFLFRIITLLTENNWAALLGSLALTTNLNFLYLQSTPMFEPLLIATILGALHFLIRWSISNQAVDLTLAAFWTMLATLTRYDGWAFFISAIVLIGVFILRTDRTKREGPLVLFITLAGFGIVLWLLYNLLIFHDPLYFQRGPYSAQAQQQVLALRNQLPTAHNLPLSIKTYAVTTLLNLGPLPVLLALIGLSVYLVKEWRKPVFWFPLLLLVPFIFNATSLYSGQSVIWLPMLPPSYGTYFNARYGILMLPAAAFFIGYLASRHFWLRWVVFLGLIIQVTLFAVPSLIPLYGRQIGLVTLQDTVSSVNGQTIAASGFLHAHYTGGKVLVSSASSDAFIFRSDIPLQQIISEGSGNYWKSSLENPSANANWLVFFVNHSDSVGKVMNNYPQRMIGYSMMYEDPTYQIWLKT